MEDAHYLQLPRLGLRNIKTGISATLCAVLYSFIDRNPTFACIGAVFGMDNSIENSLRTGGNRLAGTIIGGFMGMLVFYVYQEYFLTASAFTIPLALCLLGGIMLMIYLCQVLHAVGAVHAGAVVFFIVMLNTPPDEYVSYALDRMVDTGFGVIMSLTINALLPREWLEKHMSRKGLDKEINQLEKNKEDFESQADQLLEELRSIEYRKYPETAEEEKKGLKS